NFSGADLDSQINLSNNHVEINSANLHNSINSSANISIYNLTFLHDPVVYKDGSLCITPECNTTNYENNTLNMTVSGFSTYAAGANALLTIWDPTDIKGGENTVYPDDDVVFTANYSNISGTPLNRSDIFCNISFSDRENATRMNYSSTTGLYTYTRSFSSHISYGWNVSCNATSLGYEPIYINRSITITCKESWTCGEWSSCSGGTQTRTCTDSNSCGTTLTRPQLSQSCTVDTDDGGSSPSGSSPGGGSPGGGSPSSTTQDPNVRSKSWYSISSQNTVIWNIDDFDISRLEFNTDQDYEYPKLTIRLSDTAPSETIRVNDSYRYISIEPSNIEIDEGTISFRVEKSWLSGKDKEEISLLKGGNLPREVRTEYLNSDSGYHYYRAYVSGTGNFVVVSKVPPSFDLDKDVIQMEAFTGSLTRETITIKNNDDSPVNYSLELKDLEKFVSLSEKEFTLNPGEEKILNLDFYFDSELVSDVFMGQVLIRSGKSSKGVNVILDLKEKNPLFDLEVDCLHDSVDAGDSIGAVINVINMGELENFDIYVNHAIRDLDGETYISREESIAITKKLETVLELDVPKDLPDGQYAYYVQIRYNNVTASGYDLFTVGENLFWKLDFKKIAIVALIIFVLALITAFVMEYKKKVDENNYEETKEDTKSELSLDEKRVLEYIQKTTKLGLKLEDIKDKLLSAGWKIDIVDRVIELYKNPSKYEDDKPPQKNAVSGNENTVSQKEQSTSTLNIKETDPKKNLNNPSSKIKKGNASDSDDNKKTDEINPEIKNQENKKSPEQIELSENEQKIMNYIVNLEKTGISEDEIKLSLFKSGFDTASVTRVFQIYHENKKNN
ncbi:MAG: hypothetical protein ACLFPQ_01020, partial [Candidatus Woesearchaeota archaeon]